MNRPVQSLLSLNPEDMGPYSMGGGYQMYDDGMGYGMQQMSSYMGSMGGSSVGMNTSDDNPEAVTCRVFVGNLNTVVVSREDLESIFRRYGVITAISTHKGYGFVQFTNQMEARAAVQGEDQRIYAEQKLDCNIVSEPKYRPRKRRPAQGNTGSHDGAKKFKSEGDGQITNGTNQGGNDVLICGNCKWSFRDILALGNHKTVPCDTKLPCRCSELQGVPTPLSCATCSSEFQSAWDLIEHCQTDHGIIIYHQE